MALFIVTYVVSSLVIAVLGRKFTFGFWGYFFASLLFTPVIGVLMLLAGIPPQQPIPRDRV